MKGKKTMLIALFALSALIFMSLFAWSVIGSSAEQARYQVAFSKNGIEVRDYPPMIAAEVEMAGDREEAISKGFNILADYIFGNNTSRAKVAMTAPVTQQASEKIPMTAPVTQKKAGGKWQVRFMMPSRYDLASLPKPNNPAITLREIPAKRYAVIRFSGIPTESVLAEKLKSLQSAISAEKLVSASDPTYAFFNPPWTLPPMRRTEIMIEVQ